MNFSQEIIGLANQLQPRNGNSTLNLANIYLSTTVVNIILGSPIHCFVLWLIYKGKGSGIVPEFFNFNLAACELLWCLCSSSFIAEIWFPKLFKMAFFVYAMPILGRPLFHCLICFERYLAVLHPVSFLKLKPLRYRLACCALVWVTIPPFGVFLMSVLPSNMYLFLEVFIPLNVLFFCFKLFCLLALMKALKFSKAAQRMNMNRNEEARQKLRKAMTQILIVTVSMLAQYVLVMMNGFCFKNLSKDSCRLLTCFTFVVSSIVTSVSPVLHICRVKKLSWLPDII